MGITIIDDGALEGNQTFTVVMTTRDVDVILGTDIAIINIVDNDSESNSCMLENISVIYSRCECVCPSHGECW